MEEQLTKKQRRELKKQEKLDRQQASQSKKQNSRTILIVVIVLVIAFGIILLALRGESTPTVTLPLTEPAPSDHLKGNKDSGVFIVEYSDFQCPACAKYEPILTELEKQAGDTYLFAYRNFPLRSIHPNGQEAAQAAEAAALQNKFWEMHHVLFDRQTAWSPENDPKNTFIGYATELGLDARQFESDYESKFVREKVNTDYASGLAAKVNSTPSFFINGEKISNPRNVEEFKQLIEQYKNKSKS